jgi:mono/diheme cytochrome c family protein
MPAWKGVLTENQIWDTVNYIQSLAPRTGDSGAHGHAPGQEHHKH